MIKINRAINFCSEILFCWLLYITVMSETELGKLTVVSPSMPPLTSISSTSVNRVSNSLSSSVSLTQCTLQENNKTMILQKMDCKWWKGIFPV